MGWPFARDVRHHGEAPCGEGFEAYAVFAQNRKTHFARHADRTLTEDAFTLNPGFLDKAAEPIVSRHATIA